MLAVLLTVAVALAGCSGLAGQGGTGSDDGGPGTANGTSDATAEEVVESVAAEVDEIDAYEMTSEMNMTLSVPNGEQTIRLSANSSVDRANREATTVQTTSMGAQTLTSETYLVDGTVYQHSEVLVQQFNSEWIKVNVSEDLEEQFRQNDELGAHRAMLQNASVTLNGTEEVGGTQAYRLEADVNETAIEAFYGFDNASGVSIDNIETTVWVDTETDRIVRAAGVLTQSGEIQGQTSESTVDYDERFEYTDVNVTLPDAASSAVDVNQTANPLGA